MDTDEESRTAARIEAGLWFSYGSAKRPGVTSRTTFDAVLAGERNSTTRFAAWPGHEAWRRVVPGDLVRFHERRDRSGRSLLVRVASVAPIDLRTCDGATLEAWSMAEGWSCAHGRSLGAELGAALWVRHELVSRAKESATRAAPSQLSLL
jgi:hypothetical protein